MLNDEIAGYLSAPFRNSDHKNRKFSLRYRSAGPSQNEIVTEARQIILPLRRVAT